MDVSILRDLIGGEIVGMLPSSVVDCGFETRQVKPKTIRLLFIASVL
jgi:hypothetical protein